MVPSVPPRRADRRPRGRETDPPRSRETGKSAPPGGTGDGQTFTPQHGEWNTSHYPGLRSVTLACPRPAICAIPALTTSLSRIPFHIYTFLCFPPACAFRAFSPNLIGIPRLKLAWRTVRASPIPILICALALVTQTRIGYTLWSRRPNRFVREMRLLFSVTRLPFVALRAGLGRHRKRGRLCLEGFLFHCGLRSWTIATTRLRRTDILKL